jgi:TFIIF-interacting CTD phosphatase-like protein
MIETKKKKNISKSISLNNNKENTKKIYSKLKKTSGGTCPLKVSLHKKKKTPNRIFPLEVSHQKKKEPQKYGIIVLDLDETLFHTEQTKIYWRPYLKKFLLYISKYFYLVIYTAALKLYADNILIKLFTKVIIKQLFVLKLYRNSVTSEGKDLTIVLKKLIEKNSYNKIPSKLLYKKKNNKILLNYNNIILIDNLVENFLDTQLYNGIPIIDYYKNKNDTALILLIKFFKYYIIEKKKNATLTLKKFLYNNLYKINKICKIKRHPPRTD